MIHHVYVPRTILACALLALVATVSPANAAANGDNFTEPITWGASFQAPAAPEVIAPISTPASIADLAATGETFQAAAMPAVITPAAASVTTNGLLTFTSQAEFQTAFPGLPVEDFEGGTTPAGGLAFCTPPLDSASTCAGLTIVDGLSISGPPTPNLVVVGSGFGGWAPASTSLATFGATDTHQIDFSGGNMNAVGFDLTGGGATTATVNVYGASGLLETLSVNITTVTQTFTGIYSPEPITRITITAGLNRVIDNIRFGAIPSNLTFYPSQAAFTTAHPGLPVEDFEESGVTDTGFLNFTGPLDSTSNIPGAFSPGDILPGLRINGITTNSMATMGGNYEQGGTNLGNTTKVVFENNLLDGLRIDFTNYDAYAVGMDLMRAWAPGNVTITVYGPHGVLLGTTTKTIQLSETFVGVYYNQPITRIEVLNATDVDIVDNIRFGGSPPGLTFYNSQASFLTAKPGLPVEDFEESPVAPNTVEICTQPFNSATNEADCFAPGDIIPGITFQPQAPCPGCTMAILGLGWLGAPSKDIGPTMCVNDLEISFAKKNVRYFGTEIWSAFGPADYLLSFYDEHGNLIGSALRNIGTTPIFLGVVSQKHLSKVIVTDSSLGSCEVVDNVRFGAFPWHTIIPAISGH